MEFIAQTEQLSAMMYFVAEQAKAAGIEGEKLSKLELAAEEALVNVIRYAYPEPEAEKNKVAIDCEIIKPNRFKITISDFGKPFNPQEKKVDLQLGIPIEERAIGGLGIHMIRQLAQALHYERKNDQNIFSMIFH